MAVEWTKGIQVTRGSEYLFLPQDVIVNAQLNGRHDLPDIEWLIESFAKVGQLENCLVRNDGGRPVLVVGHSRWRACIEFNKRKLGKEPMRLRCSYFRGDEREGYLANWAENHIRNQATPLDDAHACRQFERWGMSVKEIAEATHEKEAWVRGRLKLAEAAPEVKEAVREGRLKPTAAAAIAKLSAEHQREAVQGNGKVKAADVQQLTNGKPGVKQLREEIRETWDDTTQPPPVREFCGALIQKYWPEKVQSA